MSALAPTAPQGWVKTTPNRSCSPNPSNSSSSGAVTPPTSISKDELLSSRDECMRVIYQAHGLASRQLPPQRRQVRRHRRRDRRQQPPRPPRAPRLEGHGPDRQGPVPEPRRLDGTRVELHLPGGPLARDDRA